ncbi:uncharacterized protein LOC141669480 isoform X2 [Apium graveolens]|uniref:uncharacterized protein LOC141669480 isoform X2 n=1 Tax=Apium graveolens TaxID=4045 RepID=UPI003D7984AF
MESPAEKKARIIPEYQGEDRISGLPDELIHRIYSFLDAKEAVQSSALSKRWKLIWTTLPFLRLGLYDHSYPKTDISRFTMFIRHVLSNRNHQSSISKLKMYVSRKLTVKQSVSRKRFRGCVIEKFIQYAISHNVQELDISFGTSFKHKPYKLSTFSSNFLKKLTLGMQLEQSISESDFWVLPALTTLQLDYTYTYGVNYKLHESWLTSLPALRTLTLYFWDLSETSFSLPNLTTLHLDYCKLPRKAWNLPALLTLHLGTWKFSFDMPKKMSDLFFTLVNLQSLTLNLGDESMKGEYFLTCPQLLNLDIWTQYRAPPYGNIVVSAPRLRSFSSLGIFSIKLEVTELENVNMKLEGWFNYVGPVDTKKYYQRFTCMFSGLGTAKNLSFDLESIEALSEISDFLASLSSPFLNLKYLKLPEDYKESNISSALRSYLLGGSPRATIVKSLPQNRILQAPVSVVAENAVVVVQEPLASPEKELGDCQYINETICVDAVDTGLQEQHVIENSRVDADGARKTDTVDEGTNKDPVSSFKGNSVLGLWQGHEVNLEFVCLLDRIMHKYPETFEHFTPKNKNLCTMNLNMLCISLNDFTKISMTDVNSDIILEYKDVFAYLKSQGFNVNWLVNGLIPELHKIDSHIDDASSKLQDLQALRMKMTELQNVFGNRT